MLPSRKRSILLAAAVIGVAASMPVGAYTSFGRWASSSVLMYINPQNADVSSDAAEAALLAAMDAWNSQGGSPFRFNYAGRTTDSSVTQDEKNVVMFRNQNNGSVLATTYSWLLNGEVVEADIVFWDGGWPFFTGTTGCAGGMYIEDVGTHEFGHVLGLGHSVDPLATMYATATLCLQQMRTLAPDDIAGVQSLYGVTPVNQPPSVSVTSPAPGASFTAPASITVEASASDADGTVTGVTFYANGIAIGTDATLPYSVAWNGIGAGSYALTATATDNSGASRTSDPVTVQVVAPAGATVSFVGRDTSTKGDWLGTYGLDGYLLVGDGMSVPPGVAITTTGPLSWTWNAAPTDPRALQRAATVGRVAATWYGDTFTLNVSVGATSRRVGLYVVDWDGIGRVERLDVLDAATGAVLDSRLLTGFTGGEYWTWDVTGAVRFRVTLVGGVNAVVSAIFLDPAGGGGPVNQPPSVSVTSPTAGASFPAPASITVAADASDADGTVTGVTFYANGSPIGTDASAPYSVTWSGVGAGTYALTASATDNSGATRTSAPVTIQVTAPPGTTTASFVGQDTTTKGDWQGTYGRDGYMLAGDGVSVPAGVTVTLAGKSDWVWNPSPVDPRALQRITAPGRIAATWYGGAFTIDVTVGATPRRVGLYVVDWDGIGRVERLDVLDAATGAVLDSRLLTGFTGGEYWTWDVTGAVRFRVTLVGGVNAVVSAIFLDPAGGGGPVNQPPSVSVTSPTAGASFPAPASITVAADASDADGTVTGVTFYANGSPIGTDASAPYSVTWSGVGAGTYALTASATDNSGATRTSAPVTIQVTAPPGTTTASFVGQDTTTKGDWQGTYGRDGYVLAGDGVSVPAGVTVTLAGKSDWVWNPSPVDPRALQRITAPGRIAATWYGGAFTIDVTVGATPRRVGLYVVDWDFHGRVERIDVLDAATGAVLDSRLLTGFTGGEYWTWDVTGAVRFRVTLVGGVNAVVSALFLNPPGS